MSFKEEIKNQFLVSSNIISMLKSPSNWLLAFVAYQVWLLLGMRYSSNQNFDMTVIPQYYILVVSSISILAGLINTNKKQLILTILGAITVVVSLLTIVVSKVGVYWFGYPMGIIFYVLLASFYSCGKSRELYVWHTTTIKKS